MRVSLNRIPIAEHRTPMNLTLDTPTIAGIPALIVAPHGTAHSPVVFYVPGYTSTRESGIRFGVEIARAGFLFVAFDPVHHGARADGAIEAAGDPAHAVYPPETGLGTGVLFFQTIGQCLEDIRTLRAHLTADPRANVEICGVTGPSMGGYASYLAFARLPQMRAAVPMMGIPTFARRWRDLLDECTLSNPEWAAALAHIPGPIADHTASIESIDPAPALAAAAPRALFAMANDFDTDQPKLYTIETVRALLPAWRAAGAPDAIRLGIYPAAHTVTPAMEQDAVAWFRRFLR
jgi:dienelactone hydrolase